MDYTPLVVLYLILGILYIILSGVDLPTSIDNWLHKNHEITYLLIGTVYALIAVVYLYGNKPHHPANQKHRKKLTYFTYLHQNNKSIISLLIIIFLIYVWYKIIYIDTSHNYKGHF